MDPLRTLREACSSGKLDDVTIGENGMVQFGDRYEFPGNTHTNFHESSGSREAYPLSALVFFLKKRTQVGSALSQAEYIKECMSNKLTKVSLTDHQNAWNYFNGTVATVPNIRDAEPAPAHTGKRPRAAAEEEAVEKPAKRAASYKEYERKLRGRQNLLVVPSKDFGMAINLYKQAALVHSEKLKDALKKYNKATNPKAGKGTKPTDASKPPPPPPAAPPPPPGAQSSSSRINRKPVEPSEQEKRIGVEVFATKGDAQPPGPQEGASRKPSASGSHPQPHGHGSKGGRSHHGHGPPGKHAPGKKPPQPQKQPPIIIVPEGESALINMWNAKQLLEGGRYVDTSTGRKELNNEKPQTLHIKRPSTADPARMLHFEVRDHPPGASSMSWDRVAAVVCQGKKWQFSKYPYQGASKGEMVETFSWVCGLFLHFSDEEVPALVRNWNVKILELDRTTRHNDTKTVQTMFTHLTKFLDNIQKDKRSIKVGCKPERLLYK